MATLYSISTDTQPCELREAKIWKRPSSIIKSPYVADIVFNLDTTEEYEALAHTPSLGCGGLCETGASVIIGKSTNPDAKCEYVIYMSILFYSNGNETVVATHPKLAERCVECGLKSGAFSWMGETVPKREVHIKIGEHVDSRFDFSGIDRSGTPFILEVKTVPLVILNTNDGTKTAYFPDGYRKKKGDVVSERALKHVRELQWLKQNYPTQRFILCFVVQRDDVCQFRTAITDPEYKIAVKTAHNHGVEIYAISVKWTKTGDAYLVNDNLPLDL